MIPLTVLTNFAEIQNKFEKIRGYLFLIIYIIPAHSKIDIVIVPLERIKVFLTVKLWHFESQISGIIFKVFSYCKSQRYNYSIGS